MDNEIIELTQSEIDEVSGSGVMYWLGYGLGVATVGAGNFYAELPAGYALL